MHARLHWNTSAIALSLVLVSVVGAGAARADSMDSTASPLTGCVERSAANVAEYDAITTPLVEEGKITKEQQDFSRCHPEDLSSLDGSIDPVRETTVKRVQATAASCGGGSSLKTSMTHTQNDPGYISPAIKAIFSLNWCYNKKTKKVSDWSGRCDGTVTNYGKVQGWSFEGCTANDFIPYSLGGSYPGGIHHSMKMHFVNNFTVRTLTYDFAESIWGHWDGTCDTKPHQVPLYNYC